MHIGTQLTGVLSLDYGGTVHTSTPEEETLAGAVAKLATLVIERERLLQESAEARARELAFHETTQRMDEFLGIVAHELRTPLAALRGFAQTLLVQTALGKGPQLAAWQRKALAGLDLAAQRLSELTDDLLDLPFPEMIDRVDQVSPGNATMEFYQHVQGPQQRVVDTEQGTLLLENLIFCHPMIEIVGETSHIYPNFFRETEQDKPHRDATTLCENSIGL